MYLFKIAQIALIYPFALKYVRLQYLLDVIWFVMIFCQKIAVIKKNESTRYFHYFNVTLIDLNRHPF